VFKINTCASSVALTRYLLKYDNEINLKIFGVSYATVTFRALDPSRLYVQLVAVIVFVFTCWQPYWAQRRSWKNVLTVRKFLVGISVGMQLCILYIS